MNSFSQVLWMELLKVRRTKILPVSMAFFAFIGIMMGMMMFLALNPGLAERSAIASTKMAFVESADWKAFFDLLMQINLVLGVIGSGIITAWCFGREFADRVAKDLLALPVSRSSIILSKLLILFIWSLILMIIALLSAIITGLIIHLPGLQELQLGSIILKYLVCAVLNTLLITPIAFIASVGRGYILPIGVVIFILILTQLVFLGIPAFSPWFPWALPALYSGVAGELSPAPGLVSYIIYLATVLGGVLATIYWWKNADQK